MNKKVLIGCICSYVFVAAAIVFYFIFVVGKPEVDFSFKTYGKDPYTWVYTIDDESVLKCKDKTIKQKKGNITGGVIKTHYVFKGLKEGTTTLKFEYRNIVDNSVDETKVYKVIVDKDLKIKLKKQRN